MSRTIAIDTACITIILGLAACTNPYDPAQRFVGGGLIGAGTGAAIGAAAGGGPGAALGAAIGGTVGAVGGVATTPPPYGWPYYAAPAYGPPPYGPPDYGPAYGYGGPSAYGYAYPTQGYPGYYP